MKRAGAAWVILGLGFALGAAALHLGSGSALSLRRELALAEPWRLFSAALWHWNGLHLAGNLLALALVTLLGWRASLGPHAALAWLLAWPLTQALLCLHPRLPEFAGLSGVLHAGVTVTGLVLLRAPAVGWVRERRIGALLLAGLLLKLLLEAPWGPLLRPHDWWGGATLPLAHTAGVAAGALALALTQRLRRGR